MLWTNRTAVEDHGHFARLLGIASLAMYAGRAMLTDAEGVVIEFEPDPHHQDFLQRMQVGPRRIFQVYRVHEDCLAGPLADHLRRAPPRTFWYGEPEHAVLSELGLTNGMTPRLMVELNCKAEMRRIAARLGRLDLLPPHVVCETEAEALSAFTHLMYGVHHGGPTAHDCIIVKLPDLLTGVGMQFVTRADEVRSWCAEHLNGKPRTFIVEQAWSQRVDASAHWNITDRGPERAGVTGQIIHGATHAGNIFAAGDHGLPQISPRDVAEIYTVGEAFVWYWWHRGYRGPFGIDYIGIGAASQRRWYAIEPNVFRPPAPRYGMSLAQQLAPRFTNGWAIQMAYIQPASGGPDTFERLAKVLGPLLFNSVYGVLPMLPELLPKKFLAVCVGRTTADAARLFQAAAHRLTA